MRDARIDYVLARVRVDIEHATVHVVIAAAERGPARGKTRDVRGVRGRGCSIERRGERNADVMHLWTRRMPDYRLVTGTGHGADRRSEALALAVRKRLAPCESRAISRCNVNDNMETHSAHSRPYSTPATEQPLKAHIDSQRTDRHLVVGEAVTGEVTFPTIDEMTNSFCGVLCVAEEWREAFGSVRRVLRSQSSTARQRRGYMEVKEDEGRQGRWS